MQTLQTGYPLHGWCISKGWSWRSAIKKTSFSCDCPIAFHHFRIISTTYLKIRKNQLYKQLTTNKNYKQNKEQ
jgi:hypothetical protein